MILWRINAGMFFLLSLVYSTFMGDVQQAIHLGVLALLFPLLEIACRLENVSTGKVVVTVLEPEEME